MAAEDPKTIEIAAVIEEIRARVRERYPTHTAGPSQVPLADLNPLLHARDRAEGKVAAIGTVNPRPPGVVNQLLQSVKHSVARGLNWFVRDQVEFNRAALDCVQATLEALNDTNRAVAALAAHHEARMGELRGELRAAQDRIAANEAAAAGRAGRLEAEARELKDVRTHWAEWRKDWERKLTINEVQFLRAVADLQTAFQHRVSLMESNFRETVAGQHREFGAALDEARIEIQERYWKEWEKAHREFEKLIHSELRVLRQRGVGAAPAPAAAMVVSPPGASQWEAPPIDFLRFADRFRGTEEWVRRSQQPYVQHFAGADQIVDLGCGRGEFLETLRDAGKLVKGVDSSAELVAICRSKGLYAEQADIFEYLGELDGESLDGIFCGQVIEHLPPHRLPELISLAAAALRPGGRIVFETPNPECLAIFATHFYLDPTHQRPVPAQLLVFYLEEAGFGRIGVEYRNPAIETLPGLAELPESFRKAWFGGLDYAVAATRL